MQIEIKKEELEEITSVLKQSIKLKAGFACCCFVEVCCAYLLSKFELQVSSALIYRIFVASNVLLWVSIGIGVLIAYECLVLFRLKRGKFKTLVSKRRHYFNKKVLRSEGESVCLKILLTRLFVRRFEYDK